MPRSLLFWLTPRRALGVCLTLVLVQIYYLLGDRQSFPVFDAAHIGEFYTPRRHVVEQITNLTNSYAPNAKGSVGIVLASIHSDDLTWLLDHCKETNRTPFVYTTDPHPEQGLLVPPTMRGRETPAYLSYIVDHYDKLPEYSIFIHANSEQWHNDLFGPFTRDALKSLRLEAVDALGYVNLRCEHDPGCPTGVFPLHPTEIDIAKKDIRAYFAQAYQQIFNVAHDQVPTEIGNVCCGQFAISRERILARPKEDYQRILDWAATTKQTDDFGVGWVMEKLWHIVFGMDAVYCPRYEQCRCDVYGWCGPLKSGETLQAVTVQSKTKAL
ncbi:hypothetical protein N7492_009999 [Penicillium capsulatum]|uniref:Uncharacterized protein n=1 Tax=Penicillium capsulatum TaxID=69766 RepID=A0A9W9LEJ9_9EURO|nr:hypothetical protein N7492_009999 [Penicillium capsulatum]KAJ6112508.1 hypothetical protein N7512_007832 [Penicillium capsulatum]